MRKLLWLLPGLLLMEGIQYGYAQTGFALAGGKTLLKTTDGGASWDTLMHNLMDSANVSEFKGLFPRNENEVTVTAIVSRLDNNNKLKKYNDVFISNDGGMTFEQKVNLNTDAFDFRTIRAYKGTKSGNVVASSAGGSKNAVFQIGTVDNWNTRDYTERNGTKAHETVSDKHSWAVVGNSIYRYSNSRPTSNTADRVFNIPSFNAVRKVKGKVIVGGDFGNLYVSGDDGATWENMNDGVDGALSKDLQALGLAQKKIRTIEVSPSGDTVMIGAEDGFVGRSTDGGMNWAKMNFAQSNMSSRDIYDIHFVTNSLVFLGATDNDSKAGEPPYIFKSTNGGMSFSPLPRDSISGGGAPDGRYRWEVVHFANEMEGWAAWNRGCNGKCYSIYRTKDGGNTWSAVSTIEDGDGVKAIHVYSYDTAVFATTRSGGKMWKTVDGGTTWVQKDSKRLPGGHYYNVNDTAIYAPIQDGILRTADKGENWSKLTSVDGSGVVFKDIHEGWIVGEKGRVLKSTDYLNWTPLNVLGYPVDDIADIYSQNKDFAYIVGKAGMILKTTNAGNDWAFAGDLGKPYNYNTVYAYSADKVIVGASNGKVLMTTNGGTNWSESDLGTGNPVRDIYFRNADLGVASTGKGEIYRTTDGGMNWAKVHTRSDSVPVTQIYMTANPTKFSLAKEDTITIGKGLSADVPLVVDNFSEIASYELMMTIDTSVMMLEGIMEASNGLTTSSFMLDSAGVLTSGKFKVKWMGSGSVANGTKLFDLKIKVKDSVGLKGKLHIEPESLNKVLKANTAYADAMLKSLYIKVGTPLDVTVSTGSLAFTSFCGGESVSVPYTLGGNNQASATAVANAYLSDANGDFANKTLIGSTTSNTSGSISATIPSANAFGMKYRIRVELDDKASNNVFIGTDNGQDIKNNKMMPSTISEADLGLLMADSSADSYQWFSGNQVITGETGQNVRVFSNGSYRVIRIISGCASDTSMPKMINNFVGSEITSVSTPRCSDSTVTVSYKVSNAGALGSNSAYNVELSNSNGDFGGQYITQKAAGDSVGSIMAKLPTVTSTGTNYKVRLVIVDSTNNNRTFIGKSGTSFTIPAIAKPVISQPSNTQLSSSVSGDSYMWSLDGQVQADLTTKDVTPTKDGAYTVKVTSMGCMSAESDAFNFKLPDVSGLIGDDISNVAVYPNPASSVLKVRLEGLSGVKVNATLTNALGTKVYGAEIGANEETQISVQELPAGLYFLKLSNASGAEIYKIFID